MAENKHGFKQMGSPKTQATQMRMNQGTFNEQAVAQARARLMRERLEEGFSDNLIKLQTTVLDEINLLKSRNLKLERKT